MQNRIFKNIHLICGSVFAFAALCLSGCIADGPDEPGGSTTSDYPLSISALGFNGSKTTRVSNTGSAPDGAGIKYSGNLPFTEDNELIKNWVVYLFSETGEFYKISSTDAANNGQEYLSGIYKSDVKREYNIPLRKYKAYGFANFDPFAGAGNLTYETAAINYENFKAYAWDKWSGESASAGAYFEEDTRTPMAGYLDIDLSNPNNSYSIQVVRMLAKLEFSFTNNAGYPIEVHSVSVSPLYSGDIYVMPDYSKLPSNIDNTPGMDHNYPSYESTRPSDFASANDDALHSATVVHQVETTLDDKDMWRTHFYIKESSSTHPSGKYLIAVNITRHPDADTEVTDTLYALAEDIEYVYRNDYVFVPIVFSDFIPKIEIRSYPPIGGYPANVLEDTDGEYYATFVTPERFEIYPYLLTGTEKTPVRDNISVTIEYPENNVFGELTRDGQSNVYYGDLTNTKGEVPVTLTFTYKDDDGEIIYSSNRVVHIIRN